MRFPYTFMGILSLGLGVFVLAYVLAHRALDPVAIWLAAAAALMAFGFGVYVVVRRFRGGEA